MKNFALTFFETVFNYHFYSSVFYDYNRSTFIKKLDEIKNCQIECVGRMKYDLILIKIRAVPFILLSLAHWKFKWAIVCT